ncbi:TEKT2 [Branchiostoma lanceolatum]|uniref:Tektin n=1 Tax=Branchiostoma lanceolatum TaxID=7740 RepID=A0A8J9ZLT0_BRALA|nr:TEKT2 [Branchiostoma lanceolatum]
MATLSQKPVTRYNPPDWFTSNFTISTNAERQRDASHQIRQEARNLRNETDNQTSWDQHDNNTRLSDRCRDIDQWKQTLEKTLRDCDAEIDALERMKLETEHALQAKALPLDVAIENLTLREGRRDIDVVRDNVEAELHKEVEVIEGIKKALKQKIDEAFEQICLLQEARQQLHADLRDKSEALGIDQEVYHLTNDSPGISFKPNPTRVPKGSTTPQEWDKFSQYNKDRAEAEMRASNRLREAMQATLEQTANDLEAQRNASEFAFRKRIHETDQAKKELEWQQKNTKEEIAEMEADIRALEEALRAKRNPLKLAHTRLETRTYRPNVELCRDQPQYGLTDEVQQIEGSIAALKEKLATAHQARDGLYRNLYRIEEDLACKTNSLTLDNRCMDVRQKLTSNLPDSIKTQDSFNRTTNRALSPIKSRQLDMA